MKNTRIVKKIIQIGFIITLFLYGLSDVQTVYASTIKYYNTSSKSFINYSGKQIKYMFNNFEIPLQHPGILINGIALADYKELFVKELGLDAYQTGNEIVLSDGNIEIILTINSKTAYVNGTAKIMNTAPVILQADEEVLYYVPTRFVAETFGYEYLWVSSSSTVKISKTVSYFINDKLVTYNGGFYKIIYDNKMISTETPLVNYNGTTIVPLKSIFEAAGCSYFENEQNISLCKGSLTLSLEKNSKITYLNNSKIIAEDSPILFKENVNSNHLAYASLEFVAGMLGFDIRFDNLNNTYTLLETTNTGTYSPYLRNENVNFKKNTYFEWISEPIVSSDVKSVNKVKAYSGSNCDVIEIYGISSSEINSFYDSGMVVFELNNVKNNLETQFYSDISAPYLYYTLLTEINENTRFYFLADADIKWEITDDKNCVKAVFYKDNFEYEALQGTDRLYPDDKLIIPLEENCNISNISDKDNYLEKTFEIFIPGNHLQFIKENPIINPYYGVSNTEISYDINLDKTIVKIFTRNICGYSYKLENGYLAVSIGIPSEFYSKILVLDAGHGGIDPGALQSNIKEKDLNFKIINTYVKDLFLDSDVKVYFTRETDVKIDLYERAAFAGKVDADMFISLHMNANNSSGVKGTEVYYSSDNNNSSASGFNSTLLAKTLAQNISAAINTKNRGATNSEFVVTKYNTVPAVLVELGYLTNASEFEKLKNPDYQKKAAEAIYLTVLDLFNGYFLR